MRDQIQKWDQFGPIFTLTECYLAKLNSRHIQKQPMVAPQRNTLPSGHGYSSSDALAIADIQTIKTNSIFFIFFSLLLNWYYMLFICKIDFFAGIKPDFETISPKENNLAISTHPLRAIKPYFKGQSLLWVYSIAP